MKTVCMKCKHENPKLSVECEVCDNLFYKENLLKCQGLQEQPETCGRGEAVLREL